MDDIYAEINGERVRTVRSPAQLVLADLTEESSPRVGRDAGGRTRVSQITTLGDYKILGADRPVIIGTVGTGSGTFTNNKYNMHVEIGQYLIRHSKFYHPYFSGKAQLVEETFDTFALQTGVVKRVGYFSSSPTGTYNTLYDGFWLESNGVSGTYYLVASRFGTETVRAPWTSWNRYEDIRNYDWNNFTVTIQDFLWLGGAALNFSMKVGKEFMLVHSVEYAGTQQDVFILSPNQPIRYEIRGISGAGDFRYICAQVGTEGSIDESGLSGVVDTGVTGTVMSTIGTVYPLKAIRKSVAKRDVSVVVEDIDVLLISNNDQVHWSLQLNPTLSAPLSFVTYDGSGIEHASGNGTITVTAQGREIACGYLTTNAVIRTGALKKNFLAYLGSSLANSMDTLVLCIQPISAGVTTFGSITFKEY